MVRKSKGVACYVRVSTVGQNLAGQKREIRKWLEGNGISPDNVQWFTDKATGDDLNRPGFEKLQKAVFMGEVGTIVCWKLDRLSRSLQDGINVLADWCEKGLRVVSVTQQIDFSGAMGKMLAAVFLGIAEMEQETRRERQRVGIEAAKARGVYKGGSGRKIGSTKARPAEARKLRAKGLTQQQVANAMNVSRRTVIRYLEV